MNVQKFFFWVLALSALVFVGHMVLTSNQDVPPNQRVNEVSFERLSVGMTEPQVEAVLGLPNSAAGGEIIKVESPTSPETEFAISEQPRDAGGNLLNFYRGPDDESIRVLFSARTRTLVAAEYRVCERAVVYRGDRPAGVKSAPMFMASTERGVDLEADRKIANFLRRRALRAKEALGASPARQPNSLVPPPALRGSDLQPLDDSALPGQTPGPSDESSTAEVMGAPEIANDGFDPALPAGAAGMPDGKGDTATEADLRVVLPSGMRLTKAMLDLPKDWQDTLFPSDVTVFVANYSNGAVQGVFSLRGSRLHGPAATLYEDGQLSTVAFYWDGDLSGALRLWKESRQRLLYAEFKNGVKNGLLCYFREGKPQVLQQWDKNRLAAQYLVAGLGRERRAVAEAELSDAGKSELSKAVEELGELDATLKTNEAKLKRELASWYRKVDQQARQARLTGRSPAKRGLTGDGGGMGSLMDGTSNQNQWREALRGSGL